MSSENFALIMVYGTSALLPIILLQTEKQNVSCKSSNVLFVNQGPRAQSKPRSKGMTQNSKYIDFYNVIVLYRILQPVTRLLSFFSDAQFEQRWISSDASSDGKSKELNFEQYAIMIAQFVTDSLRRDNSCSCVTISDRGNGWLEPFFDAAGRILTTSRLEIKYTRDTLHSYFSIELACRISRTHSGTT